jgi:hypothetical protein
VRYSAQNKFNEAAIRLMSGRCVRLYQSKRKVARQANFQQRVFVVLGLGIGTSKGIARGVRRSVIGLCS